MGQSRSRSKTSVHPNRQEQRDPENNATGEEKDETSGGQKKQENQRRDMAGGNHHDNVRQNGSKRESDRFQHKRTPPSHSDIPRSIVRVDHQRYRHGNPQNEIRPKKQSSNLTCFGDDRHDENYSYNRSRSLTPNLDFYQNTKPFEPNGVYIKDLLKDWKCDYKRLEKNHSYIQWLFPLREQGINPSSTPLTEAEIQIMRQDVEVGRRLLAAYRLMLEFYGINLKDERTGEVERAANWRERYHNLNSHSHNNLRITRILKCLGIMGFNHLQAPLVRFFLEETLYNNNLPNVKKSALTFFMDAVKDEKERGGLRSFVDEFYRPQKDKITSYSNKNGTGSERRQNGSNPRPVRKTLCHL